jgi:hypothetical protein
MPPRHERPCFLGQLYVNLCSQSDDNNPQKDLARLGYKTRYESKKY